MKWYICLYIALIGFTNSGAQTFQKEVDSLLGELPKASNDTIKARIYRSLYNILQYQDPDKAIGYAKKGLAVATKMKWEKGLTIFNIDIGSFYNNTSDHALAIEHYLKALETITSLPSEGPLLYNNLSIAFAKEENLRMAETYAKKALASSIEINDSINISTSYDQLGLISIKKNERSKALRLFNKALQFNPLDETIQKATILNHLADIEPDLSKKRQLHLRSKEIWDRQDPTFLLAISNLMSLAENNLAVLQQDSLLKTSGLNMSPSELMDETKTLLHRSIKISRSSNIGQNLMHAYGLLSKLYAIEKVNDSAYYYLSENLVLYDSIFSQENKNKIAALESQKEIALRDKELLINRLILRTKERQKWFYIGGILLLGIIGALLFYQSKNRQRTNQKLQLLNTELDHANKIKTRFFSILNHDLRSPVANLIHFLHLQKDNPEMLDDATKKRMQSKTISGAENLLSSMEDILLWSKGQMENFRPEPTKVAVDQLFEDTKKVFSGYRNILFEYHNPDSIEIFTDENYLKTIVRNLTSNAINIFTTTKDPQIIWKAWQENGLPYLSITDNGPGAAQEQFKALYDDREVVGIKSGLGLHLIRDLAKAIDCTITVDSRPNLGTTFILSFNG
ncbi:MAG: ATP-binding protein [Sediminicola sp.]